MTHQVLLVDDDENLLNGLKRNLRSEPFDVLTAPGASEALAILEERTIDAVVSDEHMPGLSGTELLTEIRTRYPDTVRIMLTGEADVDTAMRAINQGEIYRFLTKPCDARDLALCIRQGLEQRDLLVESRRLLERVKRQDAVMEQLEAENPGITRVNRSGDGSIEIDPGDFPDLQAVLEELKAENERVD